jgi:GNAT superfamily N-acetyltransferase
MGRNTADFHGYTLEFEHADTSPVEDCDHHRVDAFDRDGEHAGSLIWFTHDAGARTPGAIDVDVEPEHQRKGLATAMYNFAMKKAQQYKTIKPSLEASLYGDEGYAWAKSLGYRKIGDLQ